uniref:TSA: Wollemia nobilis Ref_Wollemi_Transcript_26083_1213 transcribed RNA sequence n=1 Tax=Wollemia nobilis TaxID=56998 RepID=A0A0C9S197_9CONI
MISMTPNKPLLGTLSIKDCPMLDTLNFVSTQLGFRHKPSITKAHLHNHIASALPSPKIPTLNFSTKPLQLFTSPLLRPCDHRLHSSGNNGVSPSLLQRPTYAPKEERAEEEEEDGNESDLFGDDEEEEEDGEVNFTNWIDWEDEILKDTQPLTRFVKMILHSHRYRSGERLAPEDEKIVLEKLLPYHPDLEEKVGCGVDFISVAYHPDFAYSRCLFITRTDGESIDFSFWKCLRGLVRKKYPLFAETFIAKHLTPRSS